jgi:hypothetical protein
LRDTATDDARLQSDQIVDVPAIEREFLELKRVDTGGHAALLSFDLSLTLADGDTLADRAELEHKVDARRFADANDDLVANGCTKAIARRFNAVCSSGKVEDSEKALFRSVSFSSNSGSSIRDTHRSARYRRSRTVADHTLHGTTELSARLKREQEDKNRQTAG